MTVVVSFIKAKAGGVTGMGRVRARENITIPGSTTTAAEEGDLIIIGNSETSMVAVAWGSTPDAAATAESTTTSAGVCVGPGAVSYPIRPNVGDKVNAKVVT
ncbi:hypothetical protein ACQR1I_36240 [Bradyrhizobium sp. HKCCYLS2038]|uniref:hypothetical protein n=1 Tax=Bradyrhizobium sp. HKCCYLS2038 TaxID=3420764 RepID=UPI003EC013AE